MTVERELNEAPGGLGDGPETPAQQERMESLGEMAGMVAHDFNNLLTAILGFADLIRTSGNLDERDLENLEMITDAANRGSDLTQRLLSFARGGLLRYELLDLGEVVAAAVEMARASAPGVVTVEAALTSEPVVLSGDENQLLRAVLNVLVNATEAASNTEAGGVRVALVRSDSRALLTIEDDGPGMAEATAARIFEPFYTTKEPGAGTGLGLAITYGVVQAHGGRITVESKPGESTRFTISLPLGDSPA